MILSQKEQNKTSIYYIASFEACLGYIDRSCFIKTNGVYKGENYSFLLVGCGT
jgi:hypothetical protein